MTDPEFDALVSAAMAAPLVGWKFPFLESRRRVDAMAWDYSAMARSMMAEADNVLDHGTGGGEVLATLGRPRGLLVASEAYEPNVAVAARTLAPHGVPVVRVAGDTFMIRGPEDGHVERRLPFADETFDLVLARHIAFSADEVFRVLRPGGRVLHQTGRVGPRRPGEVDLIDHFPGAVGPPWPGYSVTGELSAAGLVIEDYREQRHCTHYLDIAAVIFLLRAAPWAIQGFTVDGYRDRLSELHQHIRENGSLVTSGTAILAVASKPA